MRCDSSTRFIRVWCEKSHYFKTSEGRATHSFWQSLLGCNSPSQYFFSTASSLHLLYHPSWSSVSQTFGVETSQHKPSPQIPPPTKNGMNNQQSTNYLWEINPKKKNIHPTWITHWCVRVLPGETFLRMGKLIPRIWKRLSSPMFPKVAFPYVVSTSRLGCPKGGLKDAWGLGRLGVWFMLVVGWWLMVGFQKGSVFLETRHFLGGCKAAKFHLIYAVTFKCIHKEIHGLESTTQYGSQN